MVRTAPVKRNSSDTENVGGSPPKVTKVSSQSISKSKRRLLSEIPNPSSSRSCSKTSSSQSQSKPPSSRNVRNSFDKDELAKSAKVSVLLEKVMLQTQQVQAEPELEAHIDENTIQAEEVSGIIKSVRLYNFMCHESFYKEFHPNLNFITGENGSGKSAVLSGILVGLGARALTTARTKSIKSLIKTGKDFAKIEITLINRGLLDENKYGETLTIERVIDKNGSSTYKLKSLGKARQLRKCELDYILRSLGILLDNPVAILNQETARSFLRSKNPKDKYKLFYEGTLLKSCDELMAECKDNLAAARENFERQKETISVNQDEVTRLQGILRKIVEVDEMKILLNKSGIEFTWSKVIVLEKVIAQKEIELEDKNDKLKKFEEGTQQFLQERQKLESDSSPSNVQRESLKNEVHLKQSLLDDARRQIVTTQKVLSENKASIGVKRSEEIKLKKQVEQLERAMENFKKESEAKIEEVKRNMAEKRLQLETEKANLNSEINTLRSDAEQFKRGADNRNEEFNQLNDEMQQYERQLGNKKRELKNINGRTVNKYAIFGREMETLVAKIKANQNRFRKQPRGPFASCFTVKNPKWLPIIEFVLKDYVHTFAVDNSEDATLLNKLISEVYGNGRRSMGGGGSHAIRPNIHLGEFSTYEFDVSRRNASMRNHPTILDMLKFEENDFIVKNALIDAKSLERVLLFENKLDALEILKNMNNPGFPKNCAAAYSLDFYRISPDPYFRADVLNKYMPRFLRSDTQNQEKTLQEDIANLEAHCIELRKKMEAKKKEVQNLTMEFRKREDKRLPLAQRIRQIGTELDALSREHARGGRDSNNYAEELQDKKAELDEIVEVIDETEGLIKESKEKLAQLTSNKTELESEVANIREKLLSLENNKDTLRGKIDRINAQLQSLVNLSRAAQREKDILLHQIGEAKRELDGRKNEAEARGERIETERNPQQIKDEIAALKVKISEAEKHLGDKNVIKKELAEAKAKFETARLEFSVWFQIYTLICSLYKTQNIQFKKCLKTITTGLQVIFKGLISSRGYKGTLTIDNKNKELFYFICPDSDSSSRIAKVLNSNDAKEIKNFLVEYGLGLSGGECSFSTICFIISMWQVMQCPFFMLDEFDVFMDAFNRKASQSALISHAMLFKKRQFFFLSPLELSEIPEPGTAMVLRICPPKRTPEENREVNGAGAGVVEDEEIDDIPEPGPSKKRHRRK